MPDQELAAFINTLSQAGGSAVLAFVLWRLYKDIRSGLSHIVKFSRLEFKLTLDKEGLSAKIGDV